MASEFITADFIGGPWDGKEYEVPFKPVLQVAMMKDTKIHWISEKFVPERNYDIAVYRHVLNGIYWLSEIEKHGQ